MKWTVAFLFALALAAMSVSPAALAQPQVKNWAQILDQNVRIVAISGFSVNGSSAQLTGVGSAMLDGGSTWVNPGAAITVVFKNTQDPVFQQCADNLAAAIGRSAYISGHGYFTIGMQNGVANQATITLETLTTCDAMQ